MVQQGGVKLDQFGEKRSRIFCALGDKKGRLTLPMTANRPILKSTKFGLFDEAPEDFIALVIIDRN
jgi:hypothetical protein